MRTRPKKLVSKIALFRAGGRHAETGIVYEQVDATFAADDPANCGIDRFIARDIESADLERSLVGLHAAPARAVDRVACGGESFGGGFADA